MKLYPLLFLFVAPLAGCTPASAEYDIDVECAKGYPYFQQNPFITDDSTSVLVCYAPEYFEIQCDPETIQEIGDVRLCSTHDGKNVRINLFVAD